MRIHSEYQHKSPTQTFLFKSNLPINSQVNIGYSAHENTGNLLAQIGAGKKVLLVSQEIISKTWLKIIKEQIEKSGFEFHNLQLGEGESCKSIDSLVSIWDKLQSLAFTRNDSLIALGGGAITDIAGFAGSTYMRGINTILIPTTLLGQVDASIGGKTAINLAAGKNLAGTFYFPRAVIIDPKFLETLPEKEFQSGLGEIIKYAFIEETVAKETEYKTGPKSLHIVLKEFLQEPVTKDNPGLLNIISCCIKMKLAVVGKDPLEKNLRRCLNLGHTLGHAIEKTSSFQVSHGEAVSIGLVFALFIANKLGKISHTDLTNTIALLKAAHLPTSIPNICKPEKIMEAIWHDKKREKDKIKFVLPENKLGLVDINYQLSVDQFEEFLSSFISYA